MAQKICKSCGSELVPGNAFCPKCLVRVIDYSPPEPAGLVKMPVLKDTPENRAKHLKEYKVVGMEDTWLNGGRFDKFSLQNMLNSYASDGWRVREISASKTLGVITGLARDEMIVILERDLPLVP